MFITAMGNRPQGAKVIYVGSVVIFAAIMIFLLVVTVMLIAQSLRNLPADGRWLINGGTSRDIVLSLIGTYGIYLISSLLYGQVTHIVSCLVQYLLLLPSYINTLSIYAFCNSHDVSWGKCALVHLLPTSFRRH
jgi:chitin synthase